MTVMQLESTATCHHCLTPRPLHMCTMQCRQTGTCEDHQHLQAACTPVQHVTDVCMPMALGARTGHMPFEGLCGAVKASSGSPVQRPVTHLPLIGFAETVWWLHPSRHSGVGQLMGSMWYSRRILQGFQTPLHERLTMQSPRKLL